MSKLFVCINLMVEGVGNIVYIFDRRPIVFQEVDYVFELVMFFHFNVVGLYGIPL